MSRVWSIVAGPKCPSIARTEAMSRHALRDLWRLESDLRCGGKMIATITVQASGRVLVDFTHIGSKPEFACAEAARLLAQVFDTVGDLSDEDPIDASPRLEVGVGGAGVACTGEGAMLAIAPFFGDMFCEEAF